MMLHICPYYDKRDAIDTTSRSKTWGKGLSPFFLGFAILKSLNDSGDLTLRDFDGYDHVAQGKSLKDVLLDPNKKMGHAFVLALMLTPPEEWDRKDSNHTWEIS
jgi:hypothetical protein